MQETLNAQLSTPNVQFSWLSVGRWTLKPVMEIWDADNPVCVISLAAVVSRRQIAQQRTRDCRSLALSYSAGPVMLEAAT